MYRRVFQLTCVLHLEPESTHEIKKFEDLTILDFFSDLKEKAQRKDKLARNFTEGWVEFQSKRLAKEVAANLNLSQVGGKKRSKSHDVTWNIKYLTGLV